MKVVEEGHPAEVAAVGASRGLLVPDSPHGLTPKQLYVHDPKVDDRYMLVPNFQKIIDDLKSKVLELEEEKVADATKIESLERKIVEISSVNQEFFLFVEENSLQVRKGKIIFSLH